MTPWAYAPEIARVCNRLRTSLGEDTLGVRIRGLRTSSGGPVNVSLGKDASGLRARDRTRPRLFAHELGRARGDELERVRVHLRTSSDAPVDT